MELTSSAPAVTINSATVNHYEIRYPSSQITCEPASVTINACTNSDTSGCTLDTTAASTVTLSAPSSSSGFTNPDYINQWFCLNSVKSLFS